MSAAVPPAMKTSEPKPRSRRPRARRRNEERPAVLNQATADEFEREGLGVAPKE